MASPLPLPIPASPGLGAWLQGLGFSFAFALYRANRLLLIGTAESADGTSDPGQPTGAPQLNRKVRRFDRPMDLFEAGECLWMRLRCQIWRLDNQIGPSQLHLGGDLLPGVPQPRLLGLQGEPHQGPSGRSFGLIEPSAAEISTSQTVAAITDAAAPGAYGTTNAAAPVATPIRYQRVFQLTPADLAPYAELTFPSLAPGPSTLACIQGELAAGLMVDLAIPERRVDGSAQLLSLKVDLLWRFRGIGTGLLQRLTVFLAKEAIAPLSLRDSASPVISACFDPILARLGWSQPRTDVLLLEGRSDQLAAIDWVDRHPTYSLLPWLALTGVQRTKATALNDQTDLQLPADPQSLEPTIDLAVLHHHAPGGCLLTHRTAAAGVRYSSFDVVSAHCGKVRALALLSEGLRRQHTAAIPSACAAIDRHNTASVCLLKRHQPARRSRLGHSRHCQSPTLTSPSPPPTSFPNPPNPPPPKASLDP